LQLPRHDLAVQLERGQIGVRLAICAILHQQRLGFDGEESQNIAGQTPVLFTGCFIILCALALASMREMLINSTTTQHINNET
jgi:hypothetical protein